MRQRAHTVALGIAAVIALVVVLAPGGSAHTAARAHKAAATHRLYTASATWKSTSSPNNTEQGTGKFSGKLGAVAALVARAFQAATGVPVASIAKGGSYAIRITFLSHGQAGTLVAKFKDQTLGESCASFAPHTFVPAETGTITTIGGTGGAAKWRISLTFKLNGSQFGSGNVEQLAVGGKVQASLGSARGMTAACKSVAKLLK